MLSMNDRQKHNHDDREAHDSETSKLYTSTLSILNKIYSSIKSPKAKGLMSIVFGSILGGSIVAGTTWKTFTLSESNSDSTQCISSDEASKFVVAAKITGFGFGYYDCRNVPQNSSRLTPLIYTDKDPFDSETKNYAVLKNVDLLEEDSGSIDPKRNSQSYQAKLTQLEKEGKPVCLLLWGNRNPEQSSFMNIVKVYEWKDELGEYNDDSPEDNDSMCCQLDSLQEHCN